MKRIPDAVSVHHPASLWRDFDKWDSGVTVREMGAELAAMPGGAMDREVDSLFDQIEKAGF